VRTDDRADRAVAGFMIKASETTHLAGNHAGNVLRIEFSETGASETTHLVLDAV